MPKVSTLPAAERSSTTGPEEAARAAPTLSAAATAPSPFRGPGTAITWSKVGSPVQDGMVDSGPRGSQSGKGISAHEGGPEMEDRTTPAAGADAVPAPPAPPDKGALPVLFLVSTVVFPGGTAQAQIHTRSTLLQLAGHPDPDALFLFAFAPGADPEKVGPADFGPVAVVGRVVSRL